MRTLLLNVKQSTAWQVLCRAYALWAETYGNEGAAAFAYYLPLVILLVTAGSLFIERDVATQAVVQWINHWADHDLSSGPQPGHPVFRSLARRVGRDALGLDWRMAVSALRGSLHELQRHLRGLGRHRGVPDMDLSLKLRLRVWHLFLRGDG